MGMFGRRGEKESVAVKRAFGSKRFVDEEAEERETYHGVLRSELDEPAKLPQAFEMLIEEANKARHLFERGEITKVQLAGVMQGLRVTGPDGTEWTMGATSGRWYRRPVGGTWVPSLPPEDTGDISFAERRDAEGSRVDVHNEDDFLANIDEILRSGIDSFGVDDHVRPSESVSPWPEVTTQPSEDTPVQYEAAPRAVVDEHGGWDTTWDARGADIESAFGDLPNLSDLEKPTEQATTPPADGSGWAAWGVKPE